MTFPQNETFDSSRTPQRGEKKHSTALQPLDLPALKQQLASVEAETRANDPKALRAEIAKLKAELTFEIEERHRKTKAVNISRL